MKKLNLFNESLILFLMILLYFLQSNQLFPST